MYSGRGKGEKNNARVCLEKRVRKRSKNGKKSSLYREAANVKRQPPGDFSDTSLLDTPSLVVSLRCGSKVKLEQVDSRHLKTDGSNVPASVSLSEAHVR